MAIYKVKRKNGFAYQVRIYLTMLNGVRKEDTKTFKSLKEAKDYEARARDFKNNKSSLTVSDRVLFGEVAARFFENKTIERAKTNTIRSYKSKYKTWIAPTLETRSIGTINHITISKFFESLKKEGISDTSLHHVHIVLSEIFEFATSSIDKYILENPMKYIKKQEIETKPINQEDYFTSSEVVKFLIEAHKTPYYNLFVFMLNTGVRFAEIQSLTKDSVDFDSGLINIKNNMAVYSSNDSGASYILQTPKSSKSRMLPINKQALNAIIREIELYPDNHFIFAPSDCTFKTIVTSTQPKIKTIKAKLMTNKTLSVVMKRIEQTVGIKKLGPHGLRHTFSAHFLINGGDIFTLSKILGHSNINTTTKYYGHLSKEFLKSASSIVDFGGES